ncbi:unnamed protein product [Linum tenue]|uniref:NADH dehydrogenase subunit 4 n=1 Tax=Linum tenue TaxID=586396 RepID=A0AAV0J680_9ROSI|nr:unnamed protein product [Linum tenue]
MELPGLAYDPMCMTILVLLPIVVSFFPVVCLIMIIGLIKSLEWLSNKLCVSESVFYIHCLLVYEISSNSLIHKMQMMIYSNRSLSS